MGEKLYFQIDHIDPLGQGVHKDGKTVCFIPKTLPGETGYAEIIKRSKGVSFGKLISVEATSEQRIKPECKHFDKCPGCQFLHAPYEFEIETKKNSMLRLFRPIGVQDVITHAAPRRWSYRNRMQLHYDKVKNVIGVQTPEGIQPIPSCLMPNAELIDEYIALQKSWQELVIRQPSQGHIEIYAKDGSVKTSINRPYADGGFTQVFSEMNKKALALVQNFTQGKKLANVMDLFGGAGNLSKHLIESKVLVVDGVIPDQSINALHQFLQLDLYSKSALFELKKRFSSTVDLMLVDPPRSGFQGLKEYVDVFKPKYLVYMSCFAPTMVRDLRELGIKNIELHLLDFFPSTHHLETLAFIELKQSE